MAPQDRGTGPAGPGRGQGMGNGTDEQDGGDDSFGQCVCPKCGKRAARRRGVDRAKTMCPDCQVPMARFG